MRIIFVGLHNKPNKLPLCHSTKTGKLITRIIKQLPTNIEILRTNLFEVDYMPNANDFDKLKDEWFWTYLPVDDDIIVLLGALTHELFDYLNLNIIKIAHPASKRSHEEMNEYVKKSIEHIKNKLNQTQ